MIIKKNYKFSEKLFFIGFIKFFYKIKFIIEKILLSMKCDF
jgi:hypothetical protein